MGAALLSATLQFAERERECILGFDLDSDMVTNLITTLCRDEVQHKRNSNSKLSSPLSTTPPGWTPATSHGHRRQHCLPTMGLAVAAAQDQLATSAATAGSKLASASDYCLVSNAFAFANLHICNCRVDAGHPICMCVQIQRPVIFAPLCWHGLSDFALLHISPLYI